MDSEGFKVGEEAGREEREEWEAMNLEDIQNGECMHDILHTLFDLEQLEHDQVVFIYCDVQWNPKKMFLKGTVN